MKKYVCTVCGYVYDPEAGDPENGVPAGTAFEDIDDDWVCPVCGGGQGFVRSGRIIFLTTKKAGWQTWR